MSSLEIVSEGGGARVRLPALADTNLAVELRGALLDLAAAGRSASIDATSVERIGTPCVQVLVAAARSFAAEGRSLTLVAPAPALEAALIDLGLEDEARRLGAVTR
jgi:anti-anti-sigma regulatory factor